MNGTGFLEKDSVVQPCQEHLAVRASRAFLSIECSPGHHPGEKLSPQEGGMTCLRSLHRPAAKLGREHAARGLSRRRLHGCSASGCVCWARVVEAGELGPGHRLGGGSPGCWWLFVGRDILWDFSARALGSGCSSGPRRCGRKEISVACSSVTSALQLRCVRGVEARVETQ